MLVLFWQVPIHEESLSTMPCWFCFDKFQFMEKVCQLALLVLFWQVPIYADSFSTLPRCFCFGKSQFMKIVCQLCHARFVLV